VKPINKHARAAKAKKKDHKEENRRELVANEDGGGTGAEPSDDHFADEGLSASQDQLN